MPNFYFLVRFLAHHDSIVRNRIAELFLAHKLNDDAIPSMVVHAVSSFGVSENLSSLRLLPYQELSTEQLDFFLVQREKLNESLGKRKVLASVVKEYDVILKKTMMTHSHHIIKPLIDELPPDFLKSIYLKKWRQTIHRDTFKVYSSYPSSQILSQIDEFIAKNKRRVIRRSYLAELRIWSEVFYVNFTKVKDQDQKKKFFENTENYFNNLTKTSMVQPVRKKVYSLEACFHLLSAGWWLMDHLLSKILHLFTVDCGIVVYEEAISCLLEFDEIELLNASYELLVTNKVTDKALPYFLKLFYIPSEFEESDFYAKSQAFLLKALQQEKYYIRRIQICLTLSDLFSPEFVVQGSELLNKKAHFNFTSSYGKYRTLLQERLLVHSLLTGEKVEGLDSFINSYIEKKPSLGNRLNRLNASLFFKNNDDKE